MRAALAFLLALALAACAPLLSPGGSVSQTDLTSCRVPAGSLGDGATFTRTEGPAFQTLQFTPGASAATRVTVDLCGPAVRVNDTRCRVLLTHVRCELQGALPRSGRVIFSTGVTSGRAELTRADGRVLLVPLQP